MSDDVTPEVATPAAKPKRDPEQIKADIARAKAEHARLMPLVEKVRAKKSQHDEKVRRAMMRHKTDPDREEGDEFDPSEYNIKPFNPESELHRQFHKSHQVIATFEKELAEAEKTA